MRKRSSRKAILCRGGLVIQPWNELVLENDWLAGLITRRVPLERWQEALEKSDDDVKVVVDFDG